MTPTVRDRKPNATPNGCEGFSAARLAALRSFLETHQTDAMMVVSRSHVAFEYGDVSLVSKTASVRKSVLDLLFAVEAHRGLPLDDAMYRTGSQGQETILPKRGSACPGTRFFYNNWDFDAAGIAFEKLTHKDIFDALRDHLAIPLRFEDFDRTRHKKNYGTVTNPFEYAIYLSTRDMARLGLFALLNGSGEKRSGATPGTIQFSTYPTTHFNEIGDWYWSPGWTGRWGYGMLWWAWDAPKYPGDVMTGPYQGAFSAMGAGGQYITVFPLYDLVVAHKVNIDKDESRSVSGATYMAILGMVLDAKCGESGKAVCK